jgi:ribosomal subunit interface protein
MQTVIRSSDFSLTDALETFIKQQARKSMRKCSSQVARLVIRIKDINGPKGGQDKECSVEVMLPNHGPIVVSKRSSDAYSSIRKALGRASRTTLRKLKKRRASKYDSRVIKGVDTNSISHLQGESVDDLD